MTYCIYLCIFNVGINNASATTNKRVLQNKPNKKTIAGCVVIKLDDKFAKALLNKELQTTKESLKGLH